MMKLATSGLALLSLVLPAAAQVRPTFYFGGGPSSPINRYSDYTDTGFNFSGGGGISILRNIDLLGQFDYNQHGVKQRFLNTISVPDGQARNYALTANLKVNLIPGPVNVYVIGGGGWYRRTVEFTEPTTQEVTIFDPWWGFGNVLVPANRVIGSISRDAGGVNGGAGVAFSIGGGAKVYAEARVHRAYHSPTNTTMVPITIGLRF